MEGAHGSELGMDQQLSPPKSSLMTIFLKGFTPSLALKQAILEVFYALLDDSGFWFWTSTAGVRSSAVQPA